MSADHACTEALETRVAFQDQAIAELNDALADQQKQLIDLHRLVRLLGQQLKALDQGSGNAGDQDERPPHY